MSVHEDLQKAHDRPDDLLAVVLTDHAEIRALLQGIAGAPDADSKKELTRELVRKVVVHETAEQEVVHPLTRRADGGDQTVDDRLMEEKAGEKLLSRLEQLSVDDDEFDEVFATIRDEVLAHAENEEQYEFPKLEQAADAEQLLRLATIFRAAEAAAPTHPHPHGPVSATGNLAVGPVVAIADRARDALRSAKDALTDG